MLFVVAVAAWIAWAACCAQLVRGVVAHVRSGEPTRSRRVGLGPRGRTHRRRRARIVLDRRARRAVRVGRSGRPLGAYGCVHDPSRARSAYTAAPPGTGGRRTTKADSPGSQNPGVQDASQSETGSTYAVQPGDTLWRIADDLLDDGADWTALAGINLGRDMGGGERFVDPDHVRDGLAPATARRDSRPTVDGRHGSGSPGQPRSSRASTHDVPDHLPELLALGLGSLACAALARRTRRAPATGTLPRTNSTWAGPQSEGAVDAAALLNRFDGVPALSRPSRPPTACWAAR